MLQGDEDRDDCLLMLRLVDVDAVLVMQGQHLLADDSNDVPGIVTQFKVQAQDIAPELPAQALQIGHVLDEMEELVGELEGSAVLHGDEVPLMEGEELLFDVGQVPPGGVIDFRLVVEGGELGFRPVDHILVGVGDLDAVVQGHDLGAGEEGSPGLAEALHVPDVCVLTGLPETMDLGKHTHDFFLLVCFSAV